MHRNFSEVNLRIRSKWHAQINEAVETFEDTAQAQETSAEDQLEAALQPDQVEVQATQVRHEGKGHNAVQVHEEVRTREEKQLEHDVTASTNL